MPRPDEPLHDWEDPDPQDMDADDPDSTPTIDCPTCGKPVYEESEWCPECGNVLTERERPLSKTLLILVLVLILVSIVILLR